MPIQLKNNPSTPTTKKSSFNLINFILLAILISVMIVVGVFSYQNQKKLQNSLKKTDTEINKKNKETNNNLEQKIIENNIALENKITNLELKIKEQHSLLESAKSTLDSPNSIPFNLHDMLLKKDTPEPDDGLPDFTPMNLDKFPKLDGLVGMQTYKDLVKPFINTIHYPQHFKGRGKIESSNGLLLYGVPGTGKTMGARALAKELEMPYFEVPSGMFARSYRGEATTMVKKLFKKAREVAKQNKGAVIFFDECETIFLKIDELPKDAEVRNVVNQFKVEIESPDKDPDHPVIIIGATNNLQDIDSAIQSRFTNKLEIKSDEFEGRQAQLKFILEKTHLFPITKEAKEYLLNTINHALDYLQPNDDYKKAYRMLLNFLRETNSQAINRSIDDEINKKACTNPNHNHLHKNNEQVKNGSKDKNILGDCCSCKAITIEDLDKIYLITMDPTGWTLKWAKEDAKEKTEETTPTPTAPTQPAAPVVDANATPQSAQPAQPTAPATDNTKKPTDNNPTKTDSPTPPKNN
ncbi:AAA+ ATPase [Candidatus Phytoplasma solani]|nr:AAA+ ATPase [Candidatus Phytoplasma solani]